MKHNETLIKIWLFVQMGRWLLGQPSKKHSMNQLTTIEKNLCMCLIYRNMFKKKHPAPINTNYTKKSNIF